MNHNEVTVILDSVNPTGCRITTVSITCPKFIVAQINTHRVFSRNSASSRAIPIRKQVAYAKAKPVSPNDFDMPMNGRGMQPKGALTGLRRWAANLVWNAAALSTRLFVLLLNAIGLHKEWSNRLLEPFVYTTVLVTSTEWFNFLNLRDHADAQGVIADVARKLRKALSDSTPVAIDWDDWHLPFIGQLPCEPTAEQLAISVSCCAQTSFRTLDLTPAKAYRVVNSLLGDTPHLSPFEHLAKASKVVSSGNLRGGWLQYRKLVERDIEYAKPNLTDYA